MPAWLPKRGRIKSTEAKAAWRVKRKKMAAPMETVAPERLNRFRWLLKMSRSKLVRLYQGEAKGLPDEEQLDDVGFTFCSRCKQAMETRELLDAGKLICDGDVRRKGRTVCANLANLIEGVLTQLRDMLEMLVGH